MVSLLSMTLRAPDLFRPAILLACILMTTSSVWSEPRQQSGQKFLPEGQFVWHEIVSPNPKASEKFYSSVFDWKVVRAPVSEPEEKPYVLFLNEGQIFAGIAATTDKADRARWTCWVQVANVDQAEKAAVAAGGLVVRTAREHLIGRVVEVSDPGQARLNLVTLNIRQPYVALPPIVWHLGETHQAEGVESFYRQVTGWEPLADPDNSHLNMVVAGHINAELNSTAPDTSAAVGWLPCLQVEDLRRSIARAVAGGGRQIIAPTQHESLGFAAKLADPQGAEFWLVQR